MKINLPQSKIDEILQSLKGRNTVIHTVDESISYYFTYVEVEQADNFFDQFIIKVQEAQAKLIEELKVTGKEMGKKIVVLMRDQDLKPSIANGKILYMYYFTNNKFGTVISEDIVKEEHQSELFINAIIIPD